ncbi:MAG: hypothetical protein EOP52_09685 [Sphingobacteriales bacterium]|nr:MAG: hypothetical protein EOP52_09685 [Sphingobacteriales bacterium]
MGDAYEVLNEAMVPDNGPLTVEAGTEDAPLPLYQRNNGGLALVLRSVNSGSGRLVAAEVAYETVIRAVQTYVVLSCDTDGVWGSGYQYGFNGQRKTDEISGAGNHNTAMFWEYDTRLAWRWNRDSKKNPWESDYSVFGMNPVKNIDVLGDKWRVSTDASTKNDVTGIVKQKNQKYLNIDKDGNVSLDFKGLSSNKIDKILGKDDGLGLVKTIVEAKESYYYSTSPDFQSRGLKEERTAFIEAGGSGDIYDNVNSVYNKNQWVGTGIGLTTESKNSVFYKNASETSYGSDNRGNLVPTLLPQKDYNGQVGMAVGNVQSEYSIITNNTQAGTQTTLVSYADVRLNVLKHELYENYLRTTEKMPYKQAHQEANKKFSGTFNLLYFTGR